MRGERVGRKLGGKWGKGKKGGQEAPISQKLVKFAG